MARNLQILVNDLGIAANVKYEPLNAGESEKQKVAFKAPNGKMAKLTVVGADKKPTQTFKAYLDEDGSEYTKDQLTAIDPDSNEELCQFEATTVFNVIKFEPESNYTDRYIVDKYYELFASDEGKKKDADRQLTSDLNRVQMKKLYDHLTQSKQVAKAEFVASTGHYRAGAGYIRPITFDGGKWSLELGSFREEKIFSHLNEPVIDIKQPVLVNTGKRAVNKLL